MPYNIQEMLLGALQSSAQASNASSTESTALNNILKQLGVTQSAGTAAIDAQTAGTNVIEGQALRGEMAAQDAAITFARSAGSDITSPEQILVQLGQQLRAQTEAATKAQSSIHDKESRRIIDDPMAWLQGQLTLDQDYSAYNRAAEGANLASQNITALTKATDEVQRTQQALTRKVTAASIAAAADVRIAQAEAAKAAATKDHLKTEMAVQQAIAQNSASQAVEAQRQFGLIVSAEGLEMERARFNLSQEQFAWEKQAREVTKKDKKSAEEVKAALLRQYNTGAQALGLLPEANWDIVSARAQLGGTDATRISAAMESGGNSISAGSLRVASTPAGAASMITKRVYPRSNDVTFDPMRKYLTDTWNSKLGLGDGKEATVIANVNAQVKADAERFTKNAVATGSFYAPPPLDTITATTSVKRTALYKKVLATAGKDLTTAAPTPIIKLTYEAAKSGVISYEEAAAGLAEFYAQAVNINNSTKRFAQVGIPSQRSFKVSPDIRQLESFTGNPEAYDLTNYSSTLRMMATLKSKDSIGQLRALPW